MLGTTGIHPLGVQATALLIQELALEENQNVLEIGCGTGGTIVRILSGYPVRILGVEQLASMVKMAQKRLRVCRLESRGAVIQSDVRTLPVSDNAFASAYAESVLGFQNEHQSRTILRSVHKALQSGGRFVLNEAVWKPNVDPQVVAAIDEACKVDFGLSQASSQPWSVDHWISAIEAAGFLVLSADKLDEESGPSNSVPIAPVRSRLLTALFRSQRLWRSSLRRQHGRYNRFLREHSGDGCLIEARLFVLEKRG